jgi:hypothetical protein
MHPINEAILTESGGRMPQASEWRIFVLFGVLILAGLISKAL